MFNTKMHPNESSGQQSPSNGDTTLNMNSVNTSFLKPNHTPNRKFKFNLS